MKRSVTTSGVVLILTVILFFGCGKDMKTPEDVKGTVAWLDSRSALPVFPFGSNYIYLFVTSHECPISREMREDIYSRPEIIDYMNKSYTCISIFLDSIESVEFLGSERTRLELMRMLQVEGYPTHFICSPQGLVVGSREGFMELIELKQLLKYYAEGYSEKYDFDAYLNTDAAGLDTVFGEF
jgi:thioredoxin-related protein